MLFRKTDEHGEYFKIGEKNPLFHALQFFPAGFITHE
jgi:hypothetical protein